MAVINGRKKKSGARRKLVWLAIILFVIAAAAVYAARPKPSQYSTVEAATGDISAYYSFTGNVEAKTRQAVLSEKVMQVSEITVKEGDRVNAGDVLIRTTTGDEIKAKISGEAANIKVEQNTSVLSGVKLLEIVDYSTLQVSVKVDEYDLGSVVPGKTATVKLNSLNKEITGTVASVSREGVITSNVTYFIATIALPSDASLRIGMSAEVKMLADKAEGAVLLPISAIQFDANNKPYVLKQGAKKRAVIREDITVGINDGMQAEIKSGVVSGETILYMKATSAANNPLFNRGRTGGNARTSGS